MSIDVYYGNGESVSFDAAKVRRFRQAYAVAIAEGQLVLEVDGKVWDVGYARHVLEFLEMNRAERKDMIRYE